MTPDEAFQFAADLVLSVEGDFVDDPNDPGEATRWGISLRFARAVGDLDRDGRPDLDTDGDGDLDRDDIAALTWPQAVELYRAHFWNPLRCPELPPAVAVAVFDAGVNQGRGPAVAFLQATLGVVVDGRLGPITIGAARRLGLAGEALDRYFAHRIFGARRADGRVQAGYSGLDGWPRYGLGWTRRCLSVRREIGQVIGD